MINKKTILLVVVILAAVSAGIFYYIKDGRKPERLRVTGIVEGTEVNLSSKVSGRLSYVCCKEGDDVREGSAAVKLENDDLRASAEKAAAGVKRADFDIRVSEAAIENFRANLAGTEADIKNTESEVERTRVQLEDAGTHMKRAGALYKQEYISRESFDTAVFNYEASSASFASAKAKLEASSSRKVAAVAQLRVAENQLNSARAGLMQAEADLAYSRSRLSDTVITSPLSGTVVFKAFEKGETVSPNMTILTIVDMNNLFVRTDVEETLIGNVPLHGEADISIEGMPGRIFKGKISEVGRYAGFATQRDVTKGRQDIKTFRVKIALDKADDILKPGMTVTVEIPKAATR